MTTTPNVIAPPPGTLHDHGLKKDLLLSLAYGLGTLGFLLCPMLVPGLSLQVAVLDSSGLALIAYIGLCLWGMYRCVRRAHPRGPTSRRPKQ